MSKFKLWQLCLLASSVIGIGLLTGCASTNVPYRTYYQDSHCRVYYVDVYGNKVYSWKSSTSCCSSGHLYCNRDCHGRYYDDSFGNRFYKHRVCRW